MFTPERLASFLSDLRVSGFSIGHDEQQRVVDLLLQLELMGEMPEDTGLANMLGAILCCSAEQQALFHHQFAAYFGSRSRPTPPVPEPPVSTEQAKSRALTSSNRGWWANLSKPEWKMLSRAGIAIVLLVVLIVVLNLLVGTGWLPEPAAPQPPAPGTNAPIWSRLKEVLGSFGNWFALHLPGVYSAWGSISAKLGWAGPLFIILIFVGIAVWVVAPSQPFRAYLRRRKVDYRPQFVRLLLQASTINPFLDRDFNRQAQILRRPYMVGSSDLDVEATLKASLRQAGLFHPIFARRPVAPEHLVVIERQTGQDHVAAYAETLISALRQAQVYVTVYFYSSDLRRLFRSFDSPALSFEELAARSPEHRLILIGTGAGFFDPVSGILNSWTALVKLFARRVFMTPVPRELWGYREQVLSAGLEMPVLPLEAGSIAEMVQLLTADEPRWATSPQPLVSAQAQAEANLADLLEDRPVRWIDSGTLASETLSTLNQALRRAFTTETYNWLAACAVFPGLNWNFTVHLGQSLAAMPGGKQSSQHLLQIANLPWFRIGQMPAWLRDMLTSGMSSEFYGRVREVLSDLLLTTLTSTRKNVAIEAGLKSTDLGGGQAAIQERLSSQLEDPILIDFMSGARARRTAVRLPRAVAALFVQGGWLRNVFRRSQLEDMVASARLLNSFVERTHVQGVEIKSANTQTRLHRKTAVVSAVLNQTGEPIAPPDDCYLYVPVRNRPARLLDAPTALLYRQRRRTLFRLSALSMALLVLLGGFFYQTWAYALVLVVVVTAWLFGAFPLLRLFIMRPVTRRLALFPAFLPTGKVRRLCSTFTRDGVPLARQKPRTTVTPSIYDYLSEAEHSTQLRKAVIASTVGTAIEWYDFFLYGTAAGLVFGKLYFPNTDPLSATLLAFGTYFIGFVGRPIGAAIFGHYGDRIGRKATLIATLMCMGLATFFIAFVPTFASIGIWGAVILTVLRALQGISVGGEWGGSVLMSMEWARTHGQRGLVASWPQFGVPCGLLLSTGAIALFSAWTGDQFAVWGWRIPFALSIVLVGIGLWIRLGILETPVFQKLLDEQKIESAPIVEVIKKQPREIILSAFLRMAEQAPFYIFTAFVFAYTVGTLKMNREFILSAVIVAAIVSFFTIPFCGHLSDKIGRKNMYLIGAATMGVFGFIYFAMVDTATPALVFIAIVLSLIPHDMQYGPQSALIAESFTPRLRYSGASLGYQLASLIAGGPSPIIATALFAAYHSGYAIAVYIAFCAVVSLIAAAMMPDYTGKDISAEYDA